MLFKQIHLNGILEGRVTLAFRKWKKPAVKPGSLIKTSIGQVKIDHISEVGIADVTEQEAEQAGFGSLGELTKQLQSVDEGSVYRIGVSYHSPDPRIKLRNQHTLTPSEFSALEAKLARLDQYSKQGNWTMEILEAIRQNPRLKAADLAKLTKKEKDWLKLNVRKLKNLGLTISHHPGYEISPLGAAFLDRAL